MQHTALKQIKYNRGQVTDKLSERSDMGLQNACGVVYDNVYINRYGQLQKAPIVRFASDIGLNSRGIGTTALFFLFDTGNDKVIPIIVGKGGVSAYKPLSKSDPIQKTDFSTPLQSFTFATSYENIPEKAYQFGANIVVYGQNTKPILIAIVPLAPNYEQWSLSVKEDYFDGAFDNVFVRGLNIQAPTGFTPPTSGYYFVDDDAGITTKKIITIKRNGAGSAFTQDLVGQVINCPQLSGAVQVREVVDGDTLKAYVISPLITASDSTTQININFDSSALTAKWVFGYVRPYDYPIDIATGRKEYPDSVCYVNQRLVFGGNDRYGNLICASRIGVINDFDPNDGTESDAFSASISAPESCRIVDFVQSNDELRIATTYGEYAVPTGVLTPSGIIQQGFSLRSQVGVKAGTPICDCGGLTAYVSNDGNAIHCTQFSLLQNKYAPISLTSQTEGVVHNCTGLVYLRNRANDEGNCLVGVNEDGSVFVGSVDTNAGLNGFVRLNAFMLSGIHNGQTTITRITKLFACGSALWGTLGVYQQISSQLPPLVVESYLVRFELNGGFILPCGNGYLDANGVKHDSPIELPTSIADLAFTGSQFRALYDDNGVYRFITPTGRTTDPVEFVSTLTFADDIDESKIISAGFVQQSDWRSVELSLGLVTREANKRIVKLSGVVEPVPFHGEGQNINDIYTISESDTYKFLNLVVGQDAPKLTDEQIDSPVKTIYTEGEDMSWRRGFDNQSRELHYGLTLLAPFLIKSTTAVLEYDDVS